MLNNTKSNRVYNFCAGPCTLPLSVLEEAQEEFVDFQGMGLSLFEMSHRSQAFMDIQSSAMQLLRELYKVPDDFSILFIQGGASLQFAMTPMNLLEDNQRAGFIVSGTWAKKALSDAQAVVNNRAYCAWHGSNDDQGKPFLRMPDDNEIVIQEQTKYLHITSNETIGGIRFTQFPNVDVPIVADMSSDLLSRYIDWSKFDLVYGGVQKNLAPSGMSVVFIRNTAIESNNVTLPNYLSYKTHQNNDSMFNTPAVFPVYMMEKTLQWLKAQGGITEMENASKLKSQLLYDTIDSNGSFYTSPVDIHCRSLMNVVFRLPTEALEKQFIADAADNGMQQLKGHRSVGGCRASIYNAMPVEGVKCLADFMKTFAQKHG